MPTVDKTWVFASDNEGLADVGDSAITVVHDTAGNPGGSLEYTGAASGTTERARKSTTGETWQTWGVPAGNVVTSVQVISWDSRKWAVPASQTPTITARVLDSAAASVHSAGDIINLGLGTGADIAWINNGAGTSRAVDAAKQASTTDVRLEIQLTVTVASSTWDIGIDNVLLRMTYSASSTPIIDSIGYNLDDMDYRIGPSVMRASTR